MDDQYYEQEDFKHMVSDNFDTKSAEDMEKIENIYYQRRPKPSTTTM